MNVVGFSAGCVGREGNVDRMVKAILEKSGCEHEFVKLTDLTYSGCKGCVQLCAKPLVCKLEDDLLPYYEKIKAADAVVVGSPVYFGSVNAATCAFIERFFGYRHVKCAIAGKPFVLVIGAGLPREGVMDKFAGLLAPFEVDVVDTVMYRTNIPPCFRCGLHRVCTIGGMYKVLGEAAHTLEVTPEMFKVWEDHPETVAAVDAAAEKLKALKR
jgi:multimeric flavodoxin WrbA